MYLAYLINVRGKKREKKREKEKKKEKKEKRRKREKKEEEERKQFNRGRGRKERRSIRGLGGVGRSSAGRCKPPAAGHPRNISGPSPEGISCRPQHSLPRGAPLLRPCWPLTAVPTSHRGHALLRPVRAPSHRRATTLLRSHTVAAHIMGSLHCCGAAR